MSSDLHQSTDAGHRYDTDHDYGTDSYETDHDCYSHETDHDGTGRDDSTSVAAPVGGHDDPAGAEGSADVVGYGGCQCGSLHTEPEQVRGLRAVFNRRRFLQVLVAGGAAAAGAGVIRAGAERLPEIPGIPPTRPGGPTVAQPSTGVGVTTRANDGAELSGRLLPGAVADRVLVVIELEGGNDGLSTVVPYGRGSYYDLRPSLAIPADEVLAIDDQIGLHPNLTRLHRRGLGIVEGVGPIDGDLSHFEMVQRWDRGDVDGTAGLRSGFLARLADTLDNDSPLVGLSVAGSTPRFANSSASTLALDDPDALWYLDAAQTDNLMLATFHKALSGLEAGEDTMIGMVGSSWQQLLDLGVTVGQQTEREHDETNPMFTDGGSLGRQLSTAADLIAADVGLRIVHARLGGFDTHENHQSRHDGLMTQLDAAIDGFLQQVEADGAADRVIVATTSEFGRRVSENDQGFDHGAGSVMLVAGAPVITGSHGTPSPLDDLDDHGNLRTEVRFDSYLASLAERWLGVEGGSVFPNDPEILDLV
jgi:uncharacterized protein (DUF1501 family)